MSVRFISTTPQYWNCECDDDYIKHKSEKRCFRCGCHRFRDGRPDANTLEVQKFGFLVTMEGHLGARESGIN